VHGNEGDKDMVIVDDLDSNDTSLAEREVESVAKRLRSNKGKAVLTKVETPKTKKTIDSVGPKKGWSKVKVKSTAERTRKRKIVSSSESEYDIEKDVQSIIPSTSRKALRKKSIQTVASVPFDKVSFQLPGNARRWKFIYHRRMALERELSEEAVKIKSVRELIKRARLMKTVSNLGECYEKLVEEFLVNVSENCDNPLSKEYQKVYVREECVNFSPNIINRFLGINEEEAVELEVNDNQVRREITANQVATWPKKGKIPSGKLSVKYAILNRIGTTNSVPTTHSSDITTNLGKFIYAIRTKTKMNFGKYTFYQTMKHAKTNAVKFSIAFPTLLCSIMLDQHPGLLNIDDLPKKRESPFTIHHKLFGKNHVVDIVETSKMAQVAGLMTKQKIVTTLKDTCVLLIEKKAQFELIIHSLEKEEAAAEDELDDVEDDNADEAANGNEDASGNEDSGSSSEEAE